MRQHQHITVSVPIHTWINGLIRRNLWLSVTSSILWTKLEAAILRVLELLFFFTLSATLFHCVFVASCCSGLCCYTYDYCTDITQRFSDSLLIFHIQILQINVMACFKKAAPSLSLTHCYINYDNYPQHNIIWCLRLDFSRLPCCICNFFYSVMWVFHYYVCFELYMKDWGGNPGSCQLNYPPCSENGWRWRGQRSSGAQRIIII